MFSGAKPKKKEQSRKAKETTLSLGRNDGPVAADVKTLNNAKFINIIQNHTDGNDDKLYMQAINEALRILESKARREYGNLHGPLFRQHSGKECMKKPVFVDPVLYKQKTYGPNASYKSIKFENIFSSSNPGKRPPQLILLVGNPGSGKSTLSTRVVNDWAIKVPNFASRFRLVVLYNLAQLRAGDNVEEILLQEFASGLSSECPTLSVVKILSSIRDQLLVVLDGYDQVPMERRPQIGALLEKQSFFHSSTILVTSRPDALVDRFTQNFQCFITIAPLSNDRRDQLIDKHFKTQAEIAKNVKHFLKHHQLRVLAQDSLEALSVLISLFENGTIHNGQRDSQIVFEMSRLLIRRTAMQKETAPEKLIEDDKLDSVVYRLAKVMFQKLKNNEFSFEEKEFDVLGSVKDSVSSSGLFQIRRTKQSVRWEVLNKAYLVCLSAYYLNEKMKKLKTVSDVHAFLRRSLGDPNNIRTVVFKRSMGYLALWGSPNDIMYVCRGSHSFFNGTFETLLNLKEIFGEMVCKFKDTSHPKYTVYAERKSSLSFTETFAELIDPNSKQMGFHFGGSRQDSSPNLILPQERFSNVGYVRFSFAIEETSWGKEVMKHRVCNENCLKANLLPLVTLKEDFVKTVKFKSWNLVFYENSHCFVIQPVNK